MAKDDAKINAKKSLTCNVCGNSLGAGSTKCGNCGTDLAGPDHPSAGKKVATKKGESGKKGAAGKGSDKSKIAAKKGASPDQKEDKSLAKWLSGEGGDDALKDWLGDEKSPDGPPKGKSVEGQKGPAGKTVPKGTTGKAVSGAKSDALKQWLAGEGGGDALEEWLSEDATKKPAAGAAPAEVQKMVANAQKEIEEKTKALDDAEKEIEDLKGKMASLREVMDKEMANVKTGDFDPLRVLEETANLNKQLQTEIKLRKELEQEIDHIKKGSIAVIKYVKAQQMKIREETLKGLKKKMAERIQEVKTLTAKVEEKDKLIEQLKKDVEGKIKDLPQETQDLKKKEIELAEKEAEQEAKRRELEDLEKSIKEGQAAAAEGGGMADPELRARFEEELREKNQDFINKEAEFKKRILDLEEDIEKLKIDQKLSKESAERSTMGAPAIEKQLREKETEMAAKEKSLLIREREIDRLKEELKFKEDEMDKLKKPIEYKEKEVIALEQDLRYREEKLQAEMRKIEQAKDQIGSMDQQQMKRELERLEGEITRKEEEVRAKEKYLASKSEELRMREQGIIEEELETKDEERELERQIQVIKTGTPRLDDLLLGGIPFGQNIAIYGPAYVGKEVMVSAFVAEGLKKGVPAIWVITDKMPGDIREEMAYVISGYEEYEKLGLVKYVDAYSKSMGEEANDPYTIYLDDPTDHQGILKATDEVSKELKEKHHYYRLAFRSISTLIAYLDTSTAFKFLQPFAGRRRREKAVTMYTIERGMHSDTDIQMLGHVMNGTVEFKVEQLKTFLCVKGVGDVQSRAWVRYTHSKKAVSIGSFALDHIR